MPEVFGEHLLVAQVGGRSMTDVFVAVKLGDRSGRTVIVKRPKLGERASSPAAEALRREAEVLREADLTGVARLLDAGEVAGLPFVAIEHVRGVALDRLLGAGPLDEACALSIARDLGRALAAVHARGWVHGDVAPANVLIDDAGEVVLVDFGLARRIGEPREAPAGKPGYVAPEVALAKPAAITDDVYAWGALAAECLSGKRLFPDADLAEAGVRASSLPRTIEDRTWLRDALSLDPSKRPLLSEIEAQLEVHPRARATLASKVEALREGAPADALRPSSTAASNTTDEAAAAISVARPARSELARESPAQSAPPPGSPGRLTTPVLLGALALAVALSFFVGRRAGRASTPVPVPELTAASITLPMIPPNTRVQLDGKSFLVPEPGRRVEIVPGRHTLSIEVQRRDPAEYDFVAEPGDHVLVVTVPRAQKAGKP